MDKKLIVTYFLVGKDFEDIEKVTTEVYEMVKSTNIIKEFNNSNKEITNEA